MVWRVQLSEDGFDEIVVRCDNRGDPRAYHNDGILLHAEMLDERSCFVDVGGRCFWASVGKDGVVRVTMEEDRRSGRQKRSPPNR